ncbi:hypothetical protein POTOM_037002 [Populus tomentosa]|uniref:AB hydrolase-1 domain-containing protein n=1 Tax=Populus tomentosa TaxID=118781 RepID=A0A8X8CNG4_POPTO|nr:hypothetical protein POTOM_037002 [Populus tomentosa]
MKNLGDKLWEFIVNFVTIKFLWAFVFNYSLWIFIFFLLIFAGMQKEIRAALLFGLVVWVYQATNPPPPKICGTPGGPPVTAPRIKLRDGRYLAYKEHGVSRETAKYKIIHVHGFASMRHNTMSVEKLSPEVVEELGFHLVSFDRPGYGESDPHPKRTPESIALDIEELADHLEFGSRFYVMGFSMGGQVVWGCLKYIPHRLAGAALIAPVVNYWWPGFPANLSTEAYYLQLPQDQWTLRVAHHAPWLTYWWNTQKWFPASAVAARKPEVFSRQDLELLSMVADGRMNMELACGKPRHCRNFQFSFDILEAEEFFEPEVLEIQLEIDLDQQMIIDSTLRNPQTMQQGKFETIHRDMMVGFGKWEFDPMDLENPFPDNEGTVHLWQGDEDKMVPVSLQRYIAQRLPWINYHEISGSGHMFPYIPEICEAIIKALLLEKN